MKKTPPINGGDATLRFTSTGGGFKQEGNGTPPPASPPDRFSPEPPPSAPAVPNGRPVAPPLSSSPVAPSPPPMAPSHLQRLNAALVSDLPKHAGCSMQLSVRLLEHLIDYWNARSAVIKLTPGEEREPMINYQKKFVRAAIGQL